VVADPQHNLLELAKFDNYGILDGVTQTPDGTLYIAGKPFAANTISFPIGTSAFVNFNGSSFSYDLFAIKDIFITGGTEADTVSATAAGANVLAFLGTGNDTYTGGSLTDAVQGGAGHDTLTGNAGADRLYGMIGNDSVNGGAGADTVSVGEGAPGATQTLSGGTEADLLMVSGTAFNDGILVWDPDGNTAAIGPNLEVRVTSPASPAPGMFGVIVQNLTIAGVEAADTLLVSASYGDDRVELQNTAVTNSRVRLPAVVFGGPGNDTLLDGLGADRLFADSAYTNLAGDGADVLSSTDGTPGDILVRKVGTDTVLSSDPGDTIVDMT
jgi:Ca2+-binding RTX toxin-like protein